MTKTRTRNLELVQVPRSCSVSWDSMSGNQVRACAICNRQVHDLSAMTTTEAEHLLRECNDERLCIRLERDAAGEVVTFDRPIPHWRRRRLGGASVAALATLLNLSEPRAAFAFLSRTAYGTTDRQTSSAPRLRLSAFDGSLSGTILDDAGDGLAEATVLAINEHNGEQFSTKPDDNGRYRIILPRGTYLVSVTCPALTTYAVRGFRVRSGSTLNTTLHLPCMGECVAIPEKDFRAKTIGVLTAPFRALAKLIDR